MTRARGVRAGGFLLAVGLSFGFISVVAAIAWASWFRLPDGVVPRDYVTLGRRGADSGLFGLVASPDYERLRDSTTGITWAFADNFRNQVDVRIADGTTVAAQSRRVSVNFLDLLGVRATIGVLGSESTRAAVVTEAFARKAYGAAAEALGREVPSFDRPVPIVGVADSAFRGVFDEVVDIWILDPPGPSVSAGPDGTVTTVVSMALVPWASSTVRPRWLRLKASSTSFVSHRDQAHTGVPPSATGPNSWRASNVGRMPGATCSNA